MSEEQAAQKNTTADDGAQQRRLAAAQRAHDRIQEMASALWSIHHMSAPWEGRPPTWEEIASNADFKTERFEVEALARSMLGALPDERKAIMKLWGEGDAISAG